MNEKPKILLMPNKNIDMRVSVIQEKRNLQPKECEMSVLDELAEKLDRMSKAFVDYAEGLHNFCEDVEIFCASVSDAYAGQNNERKED